MRCDDDDTPARRELIERAKREGKKPRRKTPPPARRPEREIRTHRARLRDIRKAIERAVRDQIFPEIEGILAEAGTRRDAARGDGWSDRIADLFVATRSSLDRDLEDAAEEISSVGDRIAERATEEQVKQIRAVIGVEPSFYDDDTIRGLVDSWKRENNAFIRRYADEAVEEMQDAVQRGVRSGRRTREIQRELRERFGITDRRAERIARTEASQLNAQITQQRQRQLGIDRYVWRTSEDSRVRGEHEERNGRVFRWDDPPFDGHPGEAVNCRCTYSPHLEDLIGEIE